MAVWHIACPEGIVWDLPSTRCHLFLLSVVAAGPGRPVMSWWCLGMIHTAAASHPSGSIGERACSLDLDIIYPSITCATSWALSIARDGKKLSGAAHYDLRAFPGFSDSASSHHLEIVGLAFKYLWMRLGTRYKVGGPDACLITDDFCRPSRISMQAANSWRSARFLSWTQKPSKSLRPLWWDGPRLLWPSGRSASFVRFVLLIWNSSFCT